MLCASNWGEAAESGLGHPEFYQPRRARRLVMCAVWWRECQVIESQRGGKGLAAPFGMNEAFPEILVGERLEERYPAAMERSRHLNETATGNQQRLSARLAQASSS